MKIYFEKTNGNNLVIITDGETAKIYDGSPSGIYEGVDLYADDTAEKLKEHFTALEKDGSLNYFRDIGAEDEIPFVDIANELEETGAELIFENLERPFRVLCKLKKLI